MLFVTPDVNMLIEGAISRRGPAGAILAAWEAGSVSLVVSEEIVAEYEDVLGRPRIRQRYRHITSETIAARVRTLREHSEWAEIHQVAPVVAEDPDDDVVLACAAAGGADYIVSRDRHLLRQVEYLGIPIVTPEAFLAVLRSRGAG